MKPAIESIVNDMMMSIMLCLLPFLTNRFKICYITDAVSVQFASASAMVILVECALVVDTRATTLVIFGNVYDGHVSPSASITAFACSIIFRALPASPSC